MLGTDEAVPSQKKEQKRLQCLGVIFIVSVVTLAAVVAFSVNTILTNNQWKPIVLYFVEWIPIGNPSCVVYRFNDPEDISVTHVYIETYTTYPEIFSNITLAWYNPTQTNPVSFSPPPSNQTPQLLIGFYSAIFMVFILVSAKQVFNYKKQWPESPICCTCCFLFEKD